MPIPLDPANLTPSASLNRVRLVSLSGIALPSHIAGATAYDLLSARTLAEWVRQHADLLGLATLRAADPDTLLRALDHSFTDSDPTVRAAAESVAHRFGQHLGYLVLTLRRGDPANRAARPDWDDSYWAHWSGITTIHLGGGLVSGRLGPRLVHHAARILSDAGMADCALHLAPWPALLPLIGAARSVPSPHRAAIVCDFGQTFIKRAYTTYQGNTLTALRLLPALPARWTTLTPGHDPAPEQIQRLADHLVTTIAATWRDAASFGPPLAPVIVASIASYLHDGQPLPRQGGPYSYLSATSPRLTDLLADRLTAHLDHPLALTLIHDGTAAARTYAPTTHTAVITLGTALGIGFPAPTHPLRPLSPTLTIT